MKHSEHFFFRYQHFELHLTAVQLLPQKYSSFRSDGYTNPISSNTEGLLHCIADPCYLFSPLLKIMKNGLCRCCYNSATSARKDEADCTEK